MIAGLVTGILAIVAIYHALWGLRIWTPVGEEQTLARTVVGARGLTRMPPPYQCFVVVMALVFLIALIWTPSLWLRWLALWAAAAVFLLRGGLTYTPFWRRLTPEQPFAKYDVRYYGPLCLIVGVGLILIVTGGN